ncbi:MAG: ATP-dependent sacrificial sulfur transferase LarE [Candidatus Omnitrophica bacterium]|nr:ATP-dependent sacrificial sulfur transferase LarE [Candidatus Omnitrophota bacterium]
MDKINSKLVKLKNILKSLKSVVVAYSGGVDSTFLLKAALEALGRDNVLAVTARSETYPASEYKDACRLAKDLGARRITISTEELKIENFKANPVNRCYYCKDELFGKLKGLAAKYNLSYVVDGANADDLKDIRYGMQAARVLGVRSPLLEAKITKSEIRKFSKALKLPTWDKPSFACLASRFPFYDNITKENLDRIDRAESFLRRLGFKQVRLRLHKDIARLEFYKADFKRLLNENIRDRIVRKLKGLGFKYIALDLEGYRTGSMHEPYAAFSLPNRIKAIAARRQVLENSKKACAANPSPGIRS